MSILHEWLKFMVRFVGKHTIYGAGMGMGIDDGLHLPRLNGKPILVILCEPLPSFEGIVSFTTSYSCTSPKYSGTSE